MSTFKLTLKVPKVQTDWWRKSRSQLNRMVEDYNRENWAKERDPVTLKPWSPRRQPTGAWPILRKTGTMQDTAKFKTAPGQPMIFKASTTNYGPFHQYGTRKMVQRRWLGIGKELLDPMAKVIGKHIFRGSVTYKIEA